MHDSHDSVEMINGMPVVAAPAEIDVTTAEQLRSASWRPTTGIRRSWWI
jgi:hypothetical protein